MGKITLSDVTKAYGGTKVLRGVDLTVSPGEFHCLVGPNGSGKSTLVRLLVGLVEPTSGTVVRPDVHVGCSFQQPSMYPGLTVRENLEIFADLGDVDEEWVETVERDLGLTPVAERMAGDLSGGYRQRVDVALAVVRRPAFIILDEPLDNLDEASREQVLAFLDDYSDNSRTVLVATHEIAAFEQYADRMTVVADGNVLNDGKRSDAAVGDHYLGLLDGE